MGKRHNSNTKNNTGFKAFFENMEQYEDFLSMVRGVARSNNLPMVLNHTAPMRVSMYDLREFCNTFKKETGLYIEFRAYTCDNCDNLHLIMVIDDKEAAEANSVLCS